MIPFSVLDLSPIVEGGDAGQSLRNTLDLARHAEALGYRRFWLAEHHNMPGIASAATAVLIGHVAAGTTTIRVGAGGIMLPNHAPLVIAEQFGTLAALYPGRIDLGLGRAPGTDQLTATALRRNLDAGADSFPQDVVELMRYFRPAEPGQRVRAIPGAGPRRADLDPRLEPVRRPARRAARSALRLRLAFRAGRTGNRHGALSRALPAVGASGQALSDAGAERGRGGDRRRGAGCCSPRFSRPSSISERGGRGRCRRRGRATSRGSTRVAQAMLQHALACSVIGSPETVAAGLEAFIARTGPDELIVTAQVFDHAARLRSFEITAAAGRALAERA